MLVLLLPCSYAKTFVVYRNFSAEVDIVAFLFGFVSCNAIVQQPIVRQHCWDDIDDAASIYRIGLNEDTVCLDIGLRSRVDWDWM